MTGTPPRWDKPRPCKEGRPQMNASVDESPAPTVLLTDEARQGVTGHNVRYVLGFGLAGAVIGVVVIGLLAAQGWLDVLR
jgi:hypothetical protein